MNEVDEVVMDHELNLTSKGTVIGVGFIFKTQKVFFTLRGKEIWEVSLPKSMRYDLSKEDCQLYWTVSLENVKDKIVCNF